ncbi:MAG: DUF4870 domain-containing protein [Elusimicrobia bacterium]|nr:DUF4870 domain-containing protein [Elusimicrobiota bacterium]
MTDTNPVPTTALAEPKKNTVNWAMLCHISGLSLYLGIPLGNIIVPLVVWILKKDQDSFLNESGREAVNFQISYTIYGIIAGLACFVLIGFVLLPLLLIAHVVLTIIGTLKANKNETYQYPFTLRFIK